MAKYNVRRLIKVPIQLVVQSPKYKFISVDFLKDDIFGNLSRKRYGGLAKVWDVDEQGDIHDKQAEADFSEFSDDPEYNKRIQKFSKEKIAKYKTIQKVTSYFINDDGLYIDETDLHTFPDRLYREFGKLESDEEISDFIRNHKFCDFFDIEKQVPEKETDPYLEKFVPTEKNTVVRRNWLGVYRQFCDFSEVVKRFWNKETTDGDLLYLENEIRNKSKKIYFDKKTHKRLSAVDPDMEFDGNFSDFFLPKRMSEDYREGYLIYGHFALCCLELYMEIKNKFPERRFCQNPLCGKSLPLFADGRQKICEDNPECLKQWKTLSKRLQRENKKKRAKMTQNSQ